MCQALGEGRERVRDTLTYWEVGLKQDFFVIFLFFFFKDFIYLPLDRRGEGEREGEKHRCVVASRAPPTRDLAHNPGLCPDWELNQRPFGSQAGAQPTEPHQPGLFVTFLSWWSLFALTLDMTQSFSPH